MVKRCPRCGQNAAMGRFGVCEPCAVQEGWDTPVTDERVERLRRAVRRADWSGEPAADDEPHRQKVILTREELHTVLGLPDDVRVVEVMTDPERLNRPGDPVTVHITFEGPGIPVDWRLPR